MKKSGNGYGKTRKTTHPLRQHLQRQFVRSGGALEHSLGLAQPLKHVTGSCHHDVVFIPNTQLYLEKKQGLSSVLVFLK